MLRLTNKNFFCVKNSGFYTYALQNARLSMITLEDVYGKLALKQHARELIKK